MMTEAYLSPDVLRWESQDWSHESIMSKKEKCPSVSCGELNVYPSGLDQIGLAGDLPAMHHDVLMDYRKLRQEHDESSNASDI